MIVPEKPVRTLPDAGRVLKLQLPNSAAWKLHWKIRGYFRAIVAMSLMRSRAATTKLAPKSRGWSNPSNTRVSCVSVSKPILS